MERRQYSAQLRDIPWGQSWEAACASTSVTINGVYYARPTRCVNKGLLGMWGEWDVPDARCPYWGTIQRNDCRTMGYRKYSAQIMDVPSSVTWEYACAHKPATVDGVYFATPTRCINAGIGGMWGEWDVADTACPHWSAMTANECRSIGIRKFSAQILEVPSTVTWEYACNNEPAVVNGTSFSSPTRCVNAVVGMWGEWDAPDATCPHWSQFTAHECLRATGQTTGRRLYSAQLLDIPSGLPWMETCQSTPATIQGNNFQAPAFCTQPLFGGVVGNFGVPDQDCPRCGDQTCQWSFLSGNETCRNCEADCGSCPVCGNGLCEAGENPSNCSTDCGTCGNQSCDAGETATSCPGDCGCGNDRCTADETCTTCEQDCGPCQVTCSGKPVGSQTQYFLLGLKDPYTLCALGTVTLRADSLSEAKQCAQTKYPAALVVTSGSVGTYTYHTDPTYGCAQITVAAFSASDGQQCATYLGYSLSGPCP